MNEPLLLLGRVSLVCCLMVGCGDDGETSATNDALARTQHGGPRQAEDDPSQSDGGGVQNPDSASRGHGHGRGHAGAPDAGDGDTSASGDGDAGAPDAGDGNSSASGDGDVGATDAGGGDTGPSGDGDVSATDAGEVDAGASGAGDAPTDNTLPRAGNPEGKCSQALPPEAGAVDVSTPATVVGSGSATSCTEAALVAAVKKGGVITFNCGSQPASIKLTATLALRTDVNTVIDGGNKVTIDGGGTVRILHWDSGNWQVNTHTLTLQHLVLANGKAIPTQAIPVRPEPCSQGFNDGQGGALLMRDGSLRAIDVTFINNQAAPLGPDTGGGALYLLGSKPAYVVSCSFLNNQASNGGAMASLFTTNFIYDSLFDGNKAVGQGANNNDPSQCSYINNGQNEIGSGGNGGAIYNDGSAMNVTLCGDLVRNNTAGAFGAAVFFTSNDQSNKGTLSIRDTKMVNNTPVNRYWEWKPGISTNANTPEPINSTILR